MPSQNNPYTAPASEVSGAKVQAHAQDKIEVTYSPTFLEIVWDRVGLYWRNRMLATIFVFAAVGIPLTGSFDDGGYFQAALFFPVSGQICLFYGLGITFMNFLMTGLAMRRGSSEVVFGPFRLELSDEGVTRETSTERLLIKWRGIYGIRKNAWCFRLYQTPNSYILLPRRAFTLEQDAENFFLTAKRYYDEAKSTSRRQR